MLFYYLEVCIVLQRRNMSTSLFAQLADLVHFLVKTGITYQTGIFIRKTLHSSFLVGHALAKVCE
jgi:hypothetical protein